MDVNYSASFLKKFIENEGVTVREFAKELRTSSSVVYNWIGNRSNPSEENAGRLVKYFKKKGYNLHITPSPNPGRKCDYMFNTEEYMIVPKEGNEDLPWVISLREACDTYNFDYATTRLMIRLVNEFGKDYLINLIELN